METGAVKFCGFEDRAELHLVIEEHLCREEVQNVTMPLDRKNKRVIYAGP